VVKRIAVLAVALALGATSLAAASSGGYAWQLTPTGTTASFRGLSAVSERVAWLGSDAGTILRTTDKGATWQSVGPPGSSGLLFRDVEAFNENTALVLSIHA
jgi:photosystem II stability/assembly factor-like uncharacterized protein